MIASDRKKVEGQKSGDGKCKMIVVVAPCLTASVDRSTSQGKPHPGLNVRVNRPFCSLLRNDHRPQKSELHKVQNVKNTEKKQLKGIVCESKKKKKIKMKSMAKREGRSNESTRKKMRRQ